MIDNIMTSKLARRIKMSLKSATMPCHTIQQIYLCYDDVGFMLLIISLIIFSLF